MENTDKKISQLFEELVPSYDMSDNVAGEIIRAVSRICYRYFNDGDHIGVGYGNKTCNPAARYLRQNTTDEIKNIINKMWGCEHGKRYTYLLNTLKEEIVSYVETNPELKIKKNGIDVFDC